MIFEPRGALFLPRLNFAGDSIFDPIAFELPKHERLLKTILGEFEYHVAIFAATTCVL
jgi:hypothetical protein